MTEQGKKRLPGQPDPIDIHVGSRIRLRRTMLRMSQEKLADQLGITFQQVQKYENGANRVGASRLYAIARILETQVSYFYDNYTGDGAFNAPKAAEGMADFDQNMRSRETIELLKAYYSIEDKSSRRKVLDMIKLFNSSKEV